MRRRRLCTQQHSTEVENALYADERILDAAAVSVPDKRLGELVAAVVATREHFKGQVTEESVIENASRRLPKHAVPVMVLVQEELIGGCFFLLGRKRLDVNGVLMLLFGQNATRTARS